MAKGVKTKAGFEKPISKYKGVGSYIFKGMFYWVSTCPMVKGYKRYNHSTHKTEREAAIAYDKKCIEMGLPPVNILKPKL